ncbi:polysaccharide biosynthesis tyrosine autokinase [Gordonia sp. ALPHA1B1]|nr:MULTISPECIES: polysaccharide biosynthesis tyrosine autokinase [unclassified Gordonia (in: high G+C Gram-positive bacteria)]
MVALIGAVIAVSYVLTQHPVYQATASLYVTSGPESASQNAYQGSLASQQRVSSYVKLVESDAVVSRAIADGGIELGVSEAKQSLSASASRDTVLLTIFADTKEPATSIALANAAADSLTAYVSVLETPSGGGAPLAKATVVTPATDASRISPRILWSVGAGFALGLLAGLAGVVLRRRYDNKVRSKADLERLSESVPVLATVPRDTALKGRPLAGFGAGAGAPAEAFRFLRTNLAYCRVDTPLKRILVTSANESEGKTTTAINLAGSLAEAGNRVLLIDADLRRPSLASRFGLSEAIGLTSALSDKNTDPMEFLQPVSGSDLVVMTSGPMPPNPSELLASDRAKHVMGLLADSFDYVIVDSPPVLPVTDAMVAGQWIDGVLFVVCANATKVPTVVAGVDRLALAQVNVVGFVLNQDVASVSEYGYGYGYGPVSDSGFYESGALTVQRTER